MTVKEELFTLIQEQPDSTVQIIIDLLHALSPVKTQPHSQVSHEKVIFGIGKDVITLPNDFFDHFDDSNEVIADMFYGAEPALIPMTLTEFHPV